MTGERKRILAARSIGEDGPGTVLRDFATLLDFVGTDGVRTSGYYHLLPMDGLADLDARLRHPLRPRLKRPQQHSYPHIHGLYLLLRGSRCPSCPTSGPTDGSR